MKAIDTITVIDGYDAMRVFLEIVWKRHDWPVEEISVVLAGLQWVDGSPVDPTLWQDWLTAVKRALASEHRAIANG